MKFTSIGIFILHIYSKEQLIKEIEAGQIFQFLLFYGHQESPDGTVTASCCSQWFPAKFTVDGVAYVSAEQYMMAEKARLFNDAHHLDLILASETPAEAKRLGREVDNFDDSVWKERCSDIVVAGNLAKFSQNAGFAKWLLQTAPKILVEASPRDRIWGIGMGRDNPSALEPRQWRGKNLLGFALVQVRERLAMSGKLYDGPAG